MTLGLTFSECFWDSDIIGTLGWDTLCQRMKDGRKICNDIAQYFKDREKAEVEYHKALLTIAKKADGKEETGVLGESWRVLKIQTESIASAHNQAAGLFKKYHDELLRFGEEQKQSKSRIEEQVKKYNQSKKNEYQKTITLKKNYEEKCKEYNIADENLNTVKKSVTTKSKELEKAESKRAKCLEARNNADTSYRSSVEILDSNRKCWEQEMELGCKQYEELEIIRIGSLRDWLWKCTNVDSGVCLLHDECAETVRNVMEKCDIMTDIQEFIATSQSGNKRPDPIWYENYYSDKTTLPSKPSGTIRQQVTRSSHPTPSPINLTQKNAMEEDGLYASAQTPVMPSATKVTVIRDHKATNVFELGVQKGDILELLAPVDKNGFVKVKFHNRVGFVPKNCIKESEAELIMF